MWETLFGETLSDKFLSEFNSNNTSLWKWYNLNIFLINFKLYQKYAENYRWDCEFFI